MFPVVVLLAVGASAVESTLGTVEDFSLVADLRHVLGTEPSPDSKPNFPFFRDYPSWLLAVAIVLTCVLVHRQWKLMTACLPKLGESGALQPRVSPRWSKLHRVLGMRRLVEHNQGSTPFNALVSAVDQKWFRMLGRVNLLLLATALLLVLVVAMSLERNGIFQVLAPPGQDSIEREIWLQAIYESWWAGTRHLLGFIVYIAVGTLGVYVVLLQNAVGISCVYIGIGMSALVDFGADLENRDRCHGWEALARLFRTVYWSLSLHAATLSMLLLFLGTKGFGWLRALVILWAIVLPLYTVVPWLVFRRVGVAARKHEKQQIDTELEADLAKPGLSDADRRRLRAQARDARERVDKTRISPLRLRRVNIITVVPFVVNLLLPLLVERLIGG